MGSAASDGSTRSDSRYFTPFFSHTLYGWRAFSRSSMSSFSSSVAGLQVERHHLARAHAALAHHVFGLVIPHADFRGDGQVPIACVIT